LDFHQTYANAHRRDVNALNFGKKGHHSSRSQWNNICWNHHCTGGGLQYSTSRVELDFLVYDWNVLFVCPSSSQQHRSIDCDLCFGTVFTRFGTQLLFNIPKILYLQRFQVW